MENTDEQTLLTESVKTLETEEIPSEWQALKKRLSGKLKAAKDTSVYRRGEELAATDRRHTGVIDLTNESTLGPDRNSFSLLQGIKSGSVDPAKLELDERRIVVKALKESGRTQDEIAAMLQVSRRTIVSDYRWLRDAAALEVRNIDQYTIAGEVYAVGSICIQKALSEGLYKTVSQVLRDMVELLQSLGVVYRAPAQLRSMQLTGNVPLQQSFLKYMDTISGQEDKVINVLQAMMQGIENGEVK